MSSSDHWCSRQASLSDQSSTVSGPEVIQLSTKFQQLIKAKILTNEDVSCFKSPRSCTHHANKF